MSLFGIYIVTFCKLMQGFRISQTEVSAAFYRLQTAVNAVDDVTNFLGSLSLDKDNSLRFLNWLIYLDIIPIDKNAWASTAYLLYNKYRDLIQSYLNNCPDDPLKNLQTRSAYVIQADINRSVSAFNRMANTLRISPLHTQLASLHAIRILTLLSLSRNGFTYTQGFDRFVFVCYALALVFTSSGGLPPEFAEAMTFYMAPILIDMANVSRFLSDPVGTEQYFLDLDKVIEREYPEAAYELQMSAHGSVHYALRWQILMFADEYEANGLLFLWDHIILHKDTYQEFINELCVAHVSQIPPPTGNEIYVEKIQTFRNWDPVKAIKYVTEKHEKSSIFNIPVKYLVVGGVTAAALLLFVSSKL